MHWPSDRNVDAVQVARGGDVNEVTWKLMGIQGRELHDQEGIEENEVLNLTLKEKNLSNREKEVYLILLVLVSNTANG